MKATGVIVRFLSLLDVALILLGVLMIVLMQSQIRSKRQSAGESRASLATKAGVDFVYLYAGWKGGQEGRCYLLGDDFKPGREIRTDIPDDIHTLLVPSTDSTSRRTRVVLLLFSDDAWDASWTQARVTEIEKKWGVRINPVYNVRFPRQGEIDERHDARDR